MDICIFGDSIAYGAFDSKMGGWANRLRIYLDNAPDFDGEVYNLGISGDNTENMLSRIDAEAMQRNPEMIIIAIGINDSQFLLREKENRIVFEKFQANINELIIKSKKYTQKVMFIGLTPVDENKTATTAWDENKIYKNEYIKKYNAAIKTICEEENVRFVDLYDELIKTDYKNLLYDGLHPNSAGHEWIFEKVKPVIIL